MNPQPLPDHLRLFIAISVPESIKARLEQVQRELQRAAPQPAIKWTHVHQIHFTLRFLGSVPATDLEKIVAAMRYACASFAPLNLRAEAIGFFPNQRSPRVLWAGVVDDDDRLSVIQQSIQEATRQFTAEPPEKKFAAHLTLARIKFIRRAEGEALAKAAATFSGTSFGQWTAADVTLFRSELSPVGAKHTVCEAISLRQP
jgi:2'-5' RNA ligase